LVDVPAEFTIAFWVRPEQLLSKSYFVNVFDRVYVLTSAANQKVQFIYKVGPTTSATDNIEPVYVTTPDTIQKVQIRNWNYISISLRTYLDHNVERYEQILAMAQSNMGIVN
jgi:hypothetical protein